MNLQIEYRQVKDLLPYARNSRTHSDAQIAQIAASVREFGWTNPILIDGENGIIAGHGRVLAARKLNLEDIPCIELAGLTETQKRAYVIADNKLALNSGWDTELLQVELASLHEDGFSMELIGFDADELADAMGLESNQDATPDDTYSKKIKAPTYEIKTEKPDVANLYNDTKTAELVRKINDANLPKDIAAFLREAAQRHTVFHFGRIAEFYAHSDATVQDLMEQSALVIIDFDKAIENGFVHLTSRLGQIADIECSEEGEDA